MQPLKIFIGFDHRQFISYNVLQQSIYRNSSKPVAITPLIINPSDPANPLSSDLVLNQLPLKRTGLTPFTYSRFLVPYLCDFKGWALFLDSDVLVKGDIAELFNLADNRYSVMVSKNENHRFEWASVMLFNCEKNTILTPDYIEQAENLHGISWAKEEEIGDLPRDWNHLVGYDDPKDAKLIHYTQGNPCFEETRDCEHANPWGQEYQLMSHRDSWLSLMGNSVHAADMNITLRVPKYKLPRGA